MEWTVEYAAAARQKMCERASCRQFLDRDISEKLLDSLLDTALCAASGGNLQPFSIVVIRDAARAKRMSEICDDQPFIAQAPVNLLFLLDWHRMAAFAKHERAPFTCHDSYMHYLIALEDAMCAAQTIETAAHLSGLGSCYVGSTNHHARDIISLCNLPPLTFPILLLSLGYPAAPLKIRKKLERSAMVFHENYGELTEDEFIAYYGKKYWPINNQTENHPINRAANEKNGSVSVKIPEKEPYRSAFINDLRRALLTTYPAEETEAILTEAIEAGGINETQRRFGLHYHAEDMRTLGESIIAELAAQGLTPFHEAR